MQICKKSDQLITGTSQKRLTSGMTGFAPEVGEEVFRGFPGKLEVDL